jgi:5-methylthioadenosine/S-adenosylhomocysteine deaminase
VASAGAAVAHNPVSNAYLASGTIRLRDLRDREVAVSLGTDGAGAGHRQDMFECMKQALLLQRAHSLDPATARCEEALELATRDGARYAGIDAGVLAPGKLADMVVTRLDRPHLRPLNRVVAALVYSARGSDVDITIVGGEIVVEAGRCTRIDEEALLAEVQQRADRFLPEAGFGHLRAGWIGAGTPS